MDKKLQLEWTKETNKIIIEYDDLLGDSKNYIEWLENRYNELLKKHKKGDFEKCDMDQRMSMLGDEFKIRLEHAEFSIKIDDNCREAVLVSKKKL